MNEIKDGGPAFPLGVTPEEWMNGMSLRDYFAAKAMAIVWDAYDKGYTGVSGHDFDASALARHAYHTADAMLAERAKS